MRQDFLPAEGKHMFVQKVTKLCEAWDPHPLHSSCSGLAPSWTFLSVRRRPSCAEHGVPAPDGAWNTPRGPFTAQNISSERNYCPKPRFGCRAPVHQPAQNIPLVPLRTSRCAKHRVRNTWLRCLRITWYFATSTGRCGLLVAQNIGQEIKDFFFEKHAKNSESRNCLWHLEKAWFLWFLPHRAHIDIHESRRPLYDDFLVFRSHHQIIIPLCCDSERDFRRPYFSPIHLFYALDSAVSETIPQHRTALETIPQHRARRHVTYLISRNISQSISMAFVL